MHSADHEYVMIVTHALGGERIVTRNAPVWRTFAEKVMFDRTPLVSVRKTAWKTALREMEWFVSGSSNLADLHPSAHAWWRPWANKDGSVTFNYSEQFREFHGYEQKIDQIQYLLEGIKEHPYSRRNVITTWNTADMTHYCCAIANCHGTIIQAFVSTDNNLHLVTYQRSVDVICGLPHNWIQYWAFLMWLAYRGGRGVGTLTWIGGDVHVYEAHRELALKILNAQPSADVPSLVYTPSSEEFKANDFRLEGLYEPTLLDRAEMVV